ncbi:MAG: hypothetical protein Kow0031_34620 [Anaerolineae bacterium]
MAEVYKAYQPGLDRYVGIKVLHAHLVDDQDFIGRFEREALAIGKLRHPNIVQAVDFDRSGETYFMAMEFIDGPTLKDELKARKATNQPLTLPEISRIFSALCSAIDYAHSRGMVHRDIKPANVMINEEGQVVLTDFGIARILGATQYTQTGALSGTPAYMSPEQGQGERGDERSDIYSLGVMLYEMVTGAVPYDADTPFAVIMKHISEPLPLPSKVNPDLPETVERIVLKAMSKSPEDRFQTAGEMARAMRDAVGVSPDDNLRMTPLATVASAPKVDEIEHPTGPISTMRQGAAAGGATAAGVGQATVYSGGDGGATAVMAPPKKGLPVLPIAIGGIGIIIVLIGLIAFLLMNPRENTAATATAAAAAAVAQAEADSATATAAAIAAVEQNEAATREAAQNEEAAVAAGETATAVAATEVAKQATDTARDSILATLAAEKENTPEIQVVTATPTETPLPTDTPTPAPATNTPIPAAPTSTPLPLAPTDTPTPAPPTDTPVPERPALSGKLAFPVDNGTGKYDVYIVSMPDGDTLGRVQGARQPNYRADGVTMLLNGDGGSFGENVYEAGGTGAIQKPVSGSPSDLYPFYKPDGTTLTYSNPQLAFGSQGYQSYIFVQCALVPPPQDSGPCNDIAGFGVIIPNGGIGDVIGSHPVWTAGDLIAYKGCNTWSGGGSCGIFIVGSWATKRTSSGENPRKIVDGTSATPTDAKAGYIAYMSNQTGDWEAYVAREDGSGVVNISNGAGSQDGVPTISPDGQWVAFASNRDGAWAVFAAPIGGGPAQKLFPFPKANPWIGGERDWFNERMSWGP